MQEVNELLVKSTPSRKLELIKKAPIPEKKEVLCIRILSIIGVALTINFLWWFFSDNHIGHPVLYTLLSVALVFKLLRWNHEWFHYSHIAVPPKTKSEQKYTVDIFTTYCAGEPKDMLKRTLTAMVNIRHTHKNYLCDEADDPEVRQMCHELGVIHVTRKVKIDAKAGNINNALKQSEGEICIILDPDHVPVPQFIDRVLPYFQDENVGFVQCVQGYSNHNDSFVAKGAAEQTYSFYGPMMMGMHSLGTVQAIGANCSFRRKALESIGGHAAGLSEDMHTAMKLHAQGWKSVYIPEILSKGLVPFSLSAYYKQQLKWSRGTFELLFTTFISKFRKFSTFQKVHYFTLPMYYLYGFITLIDIIVPSLALIYADVAWTLDMKEFFIRFVPLFTVALCIRLYMQKWLIEEHERSLNLTGGVLRFGTWWIYLLGFFTTILRVRIPYIPTPKDDEINNEWKQSIPNIIAALFCFGCIGYGLNIDWNPYSIAMASFAGINGLLLTICVILSQQKLINKFSSHHSIENMTDQLFYRLNIMYRGLVRQLRRFAFAAGILIPFLAIGFSSLPDSIDLPESAIISADIEKEYGGFYFGVYSPNTDRQNNMSPVHEIEKSIDVKFNIVSIYQHWGPASLKDFPEKLFREIRKSGSIPMITWEPYTSNFPEFKDDPYLSVNWKVFLAITEGKLDKYIHAYAEKIRNLNEPVMLRFAHEMDNPSYSWSYESGGNTPDEFIKAHHYIVKYFNRLGATNVTWVWNPWEEDKLEKYYPGDEFVDWIGVTNLNYGLANSNGVWVDFEALYKPFSEKLRKYKKPVMLSEFGTTGFGGNRAEWFKDALSKIKNNYPEIRSVVFFCSDEDPHWGATKWRPADGSTRIDWTFHNDKTLASILSENIKSKFLTHSFNYSSIPVLSSSDVKNNIQKTFVKGKYPEFKLFIDNNEFYIRGIAYNTHSDWRDGNVPLTRKKLEEDFEKIRLMGANTIRRYGISAYDQNILNVAHEKNLKVMYGFWFDQDIDYYADKAKLKKLEAEVLANVEKFKNEPAVLSWCLGNEVWGLSKHKFGQPYLTLVRNAYLDFIESLTIKIRIADPNHPVFSVAENSHQLPGEIYGFAQRAPSVDAVGINSYYDDQLEALNDVQYMFDTLRPYLVSEYGPQGYWDTYFSKHDRHGRVLEDPGSVKAKLYTERWDRHVEGKKGFNIGGIAYSWRDRMEGSYTWFGLTDHKDRVKKSYYALREKWTGKKLEFPVKDVYIFSASDKVTRGQEATYYAILEDLNGKKLNLEWMLCAEDFLEMKIDFIQDDKNKRVSFKVPGRGKNLRLFLFVSDTSGKHVSTASYPITIAQQQ